MTLCLSEYANFYINMLIYETLFHEFAGPSGRAV